MSSMFLMVVAITDFNLRTEHLSYTKKSHFSTRFKIHGGSYSCLHVGPHSLQIAICNPLTEGWACLTDFQRNSSLTGSSLTLLDDWTEIVDLSLIMLPSDLFKLE